MKKFPYIEFTLMALMAFIIAVSCGKPGTITKTVIKTDTLFTEENTGFAEWEFGDLQHTDSTINKPCPEVIIKERVVYASKKLRINNKVKDSYNYIGEINELKRSNQVKDSQIDSLVMLTGKKPVGQQTNVGLKWYWLILIGIVIGVSGYQGIRSAITKKI